MSVHPAIKSAPFIFAVAISSVATAGTTPTITGDPVSHVAIGTEYRFLPQIAAPDDDTLQLFIRRKPSWLHFNATTGELHGTPGTSDIGLHKNILILAKDSDGNKGKLPLFNISVFNPGPTISGEPTTTINSGETYNFTPTAFDPNGDKLSFSISNKPNWASFNTRTGELKGTPAPIKTRNYRDIVISVSDSSSTVQLPAFGISVVNGTISTACTASLNNGDTLNCKLDDTGNRKFVLIDPPRGFSIQPKTGIVHWTPTSDQTGQHYIGITARGGGDAVQWTASINVADGGTDADGIYVAPDGDDRATGTATAPFKSIKHAADNAAKGQTIYLRGGTYYNSEYGQPFNDRRYGSIARITTSGTGSKPITLRPHGNEYVKLVSDVNGLQFKGAQHWIVENLEVEGTAQSLSLSDAMATWWSDDNKQTTGRGISTNGAQHITIRNNVIHDFAGPGVGNNGSDMIRVENNVIYNNGWWSTAGTHGVSNSYLTTVAGNENKEALIMEGNLVFANQSRLVSHVFSKGEVHLVIDEGNGLHAQNNSKTFDGKARIENNLMLFNGKAGFGINTMDKVRVLNNSFYQNAQIVNTGELAVQSSSPTAVNGNLFQPLSHRKTLKDSSKDYDLLRNNATSYGADSAEITINGVLQASVFTDPANHNFSPAAGISTDMGVPATHLQRMDSRVAEYGITIQKPGLEVIDDAYLCQMKQQIFNDWENASTELQSIRLIDRNDGHRVYTFADRNTFSCTE
ncbi:MAG: putative Ig domain-containing protein [Thiolinea sp.]